MTSAVCRDVGDQQHLRVTKSFAWVVFNSIFPVVIRAEFCTARAKVPFDKRPAVRLSREPNWRSQDLLLPLAPSNLQLKIQHTVSSLAHAFRIFNESIGRDRSESMKMQTNECVQLL